MDEENEITQPKCPCCDGPVFYIGRLGNLDHFRCQNCGMEVSITSTFFDGDGDLPETDEQP